MGEHVSEESCIMLLRKSTYKVLKWLVAIALPAVSAAYFALANLWDLPYAEEVMGTISIVSIFIGSLMGLSGYNYRTNPKVWSDGKITTELNKETGNIDVTFKLDKPLEEIANNRKISLVVEKL